MHSARIDHGETIEAGTFAALPDVQRAAYRAAELPNRACGVSALRRRSRTEAGSLLLMDSRPRMPPARNFVPASPTPPR